MRGAVQVERRVVHVFAPLPYVAGEVVRAVRRNALREGSHRHGAAKAPAEIGLRRRGLALSPGIFAPVGAARRLLPLSLGGEPLARPRRVRAGVEPRDEYDRMVLKPSRNGAARPMRQEAGRALVLRA